MKKVDNQELFIEDEKVYLRQLAKKYMSYANSDEMKEKEEVWINHNNFTGKIPPIIVEIDTFIGEIVPELKCKSKYGQEIEKYLLYSINNYELIGDDKVIPKEYRVPLNIRFNLFDLNLEAVHSEEESIGYQTIHPITDLESQVHTLKKSTYSYDEEETKKHYEVASEILEGIMPIVYDNQSLRWELMPTKCLVDLMGMENLFIAMYDTPEEVHLLLQKVIDSLREFCLWQEENNLLTLNSGNHFVGSGSYGFTNDLPAVVDRKIKLTDLWGNMNSQESVGISPDMYEEFFAPYYNQLASLFGLVYYGCCEPVNAAWESINRYPNLRKVSISPWADEVFMGKELAGKKLIYSRKPSPNYIGVGEVFDEKAFKKSIEKTFECAKECQLEFIFRDIYTLNGDITKPRKAVDIIRELIPIYRS